MRTTGTIRAGFQKVGYATRQSPPPAQRRSARDGADHRALEHSCHSNTTVRTPLSLVAASDERFADAFQRARDAAADLLEDEVRRRGVDGVAQPVYYQGAVVGHVQKYSDCCLLAPLAAYRPERFGVAGPETRANRGRRLCRSPTIRSRVGSDASGSLMPLRTVMFTGPSTAPGNTFLHRLDWTSRDRLNPPGPLLHS